MLATPDEDETRACKAGTAPKGELMTNCDRVEFGKKLRAFRNGLDRDERALFNKLLGGAVRKVERPPPQRNAVVAAAILASAAAQASGAVRDGTDGQRPVEDDRRVTYMIGPIVSEVLWRVAIAAIPVVVEGLGGGNVVDDIRDLIDPEPDVPDADT
jgi:hypothetical protein